MDHFDEMLGFVETTYAGILDDAHRNFIATYRALSRDEQCLFVRMTNRRRRIFERKTLRYAEINDVDRALKGLRQMNLVRDIRAEDYADWLNLLRKDDLIRVAQNGEVMDIKKSWAKGKLVEQLLKKASYDRALTILDPDEYVVREQGEQVGFLLYLYFGKTFDDLKSFTLRDLGVVQTNGAQNFTARFTDADEARGAYHFHTMLDELKTGTHEAYDRAATALFEARERTGDYVQTLKGRAAHSIGRHFERQGRDDRAIGVYRHVPTSENNERLVRLLWKQGARDDVQALLERMIDDPFTDDELTFASDFYARRFHGQRIGACTSLLRKSRRLSIDEIHRGAPESGVMTNLKREGWRVYHAENVFWHVLFGLIFWEELFEKSKPSSSFDWLPQTLRDKTFYKCFEDSITHKLDAARQGKILPLILKTIASHWDKPNGIFGWNHVEIDEIRDFLENAPEAALSQMLNLLAQDYLALSDGFPDLVLVRDGEVMFSEIKAEGDAVRRHQLTRLRQLQSAGFNAEICRVEYRYDPDQVYAVVDIETTGQHRDIGRITEIAVVKMKDGKVIGEWQTLLNPECSIPAFITQLTGISNAMVKDAPLFAQVAEDLNVFLADAVFVAHNVQFDYGFIAAEYARLDYEFRMPKFCTCANMRKTYPGNESYSLAALCDRYRIDMENHHRAMSDARAASRLLNMINEKRQERLLAGAI